MKEGNLEVLLVSAKGVGHTNFIGKPKYFVILQCGNQVYRSKTSKGNPKKICWNEKFTFELPYSEEENHMYLKLKVMDEEYFTDGGLVGETTIYLKGIITEGKDKGLIQMRPAPYNVVLEDDTFKGQISIGLKYIAEGMVKPQRKEDQGNKNDENGVHHPICKTFMNFWKVPRRKFFHNSRNSIGKENPS